MTADILVISYPGDYEWLRWSMKVLKKNLTGYRNVHLVLQGQSEGCKLPDIDMDNVTVHYAPEPKMPGYYAQQALKLNADKYTDAEYIVHVDSDFFFKDPCDVSEFFIEGVPAWLWSWYSDLGDTVPWRAPTERATGEKVDREYMQCLPQIIRRNLYEKVRQRILDTHSLSVDDYFEQEAAAGRKVSEFNQMGHIAFTQSHENYRWVDRNREEWAPGHHKVRQMWSKAPAKDHLHAIMEMLGEPLTEGLPIRCTKHGWWVVDHDTHFTKWIEKSGKLDHDTPFLSRILPYIKPGDTVVDCGANVGTHTHAYAKAVAGTDGGRVFAFEPNPLPYECLRRNSLLHGHVECFNYGLGAHAGQAGMQMSDNVGASYMVPGEGFEIVPLDGLALTRLNFCKVDVEGFELAFLLGAARTIAQFRPTMVIEMNPGALARNGVLCEDIYSWLRLRDYQIHGHEENSLQWDVIAIPNPVQA